MPPAAAQPVSPAIFSSSADAPNDYDPRADQDDSPFDLPSKLLGNSSVMHVLGLDADFAQALIRRERAAVTETPGGSGMRMLIVHHHQTVK